ncbi:MAG: PAS domain-containing protein [Sneathiella sp.]|nr:PAS domain-containing protein [Sneathiella sp.]
MSYLKSGLIALAENLAEEFPLLVMSRDGQILEQNSVLQELYSPEEIARVTAALLPLVDANDEKRIRFEMMSKDDVRHHVDWRLVRMLESGETLYLGLGSDVTEVEDLTRQIAHTAAAGKIGFWRYDMKNGDVYWSDEMYQIRNVDKNDFIPTLEKVLSQYTGTQRDELQDMLDHCMEDGEEFTTRMTFNEGSEHPVFVETHGIPEYDANGKIIAISGTLRDRTEEAIAEEKYLIAQESINNLNHVSEQLRQTLNTHALVSIADVRGRIVFANRKFCEVSGFTYEELLGNNHRILKSNCQDDAMFKDMWKTISSGKTWQGEICNRNKQGNLYWVYSTIVPFLNEKTGKPEQYVSVRTEITEQKRMQEKLDNLFVEAMASNEAKSQFISNMSHELRTPLNHIMGFSELIMATSQDDKAKENASYILQAGNELLNKVNNVLQMVEQTAGHEPRKEIFDLNDMLKTRFVANFQSNMLAAERQFKLDLDASGLIVEADQVDILTMLRKLVDNCLLFTSQTDVISVSCKKHGSDHVALIVEDTGPGLPTVVASSNLRPFTIGEKVNTKAHAGMGLGLPLTKKLCENNGGKLTLQNIPNSGARVEMIFPLAQSMRSGGEAQT